jgi:hypothetical protein
MSKIVIGSALSAFILVTSIPVAGFASVGPTGWEPASQSVISGTWTEEARRKPRVPGGSGCDTPRDIREHRECRV